MEELKMLIELIGHLPAMALWVLAGFLLYKLSIIASLYGTVRFVAGRLFDWLVVRRDQPVYREIRPVIWPASRSGARGC